MSIQVDVQVATDAADIPPAALLRRWATAAIGDRRASASISIRVVDADEIRALNRRYRDCDRPTNVLAFEAGLPAELGLPDLGDVILCRDVVRREAGEQGKPLDAHWAHMVVHGTLHLLGFDHVDGPQASEMEAAEVQILAGLGYSDPYQTESQQHARTGPADNG